MIMENVYTSKFSLGIKIIRETEKPSITPTSADREENFY